MDKWSKIRIKAIDKSIRLEDFLDWDRWGNLVEVDKTPKDDIIKIDWIYKFIITYKKKNIKQYYH